MTLQRCRRSRRCQRIRGPATSRGRPERGRRRQKGMLQSLEPKSYEKKEKTHEDLRFAKKEKKRFWCYKKKIMMELNSLRFGRLRGWQKIILSTHV